MDVLARTLEMVSVFIAKIPIGEMDFDMHLKLTQDLHLILTHPERQIMA